MVDGHHFENSFISIYELSDLDQIWYADANFNCEDGLLTKKSKFFKFKMADGRHIENRRRIILMRNSDRKMKNHVQI